MAVDPNELDRPEITPSEVKKRLKRLAARQESEGGLGIFYSPDGTLDYSAGLTEEEVKALELRHAALRHYRNTGDSSLAVMLGAMPEEEDITQES